MALPEQSAFLLKAAELELIQPEDIVRWADSIIVKMESPPGWIIDLSTLGSPYLVDFVVRLRENVSSPPPLCRQIQIVILAHDTGRLDFNSSLSKLFKVVILDRETKPLDSLGDRLRKALITWDCQEDLDKIEQPLRTKFKAIFKEYLIDAGDVIALLPWKFEKNRLI